MVRLICCLLLCALSHAEFNGSRPEKLSTSRLCISILHSLSSFFLLFLFSVLLDIFGNEVPFLDTISKIVPANQRSRGLLMPPSGAYRAGNSDSYRNPLCALWQDGFCVCWHNSVQNSLDTGAYMDFVELLLLCDMLFYCLCVFEGIPKSSSPCVAVITGLLTYIFSDFCDICWLILVQARRDWRHLLSDS